MTRAAESTCPRCGQPLTRCPACTQSGRPTLAPAGQLIGTTRTCHTCQATAWICPSHHGHRHHAHPAPALTSAVVEFDRSTL